MHGIQISLQLSGGCVAGPLLPQAKLAEERAAANAEAQRLADARIAAALEANQAIMARRREEFEARQRENEERRRWACT